MEKEKILFTFTNFSFRVRRGRILYNNGALQPLHNEMKKMKMNSATMFVDKAGNNIINKNNRAVFVHCSVKSNE
ncbi:hypothetical protein BC30102_1994 [Bacillus cereus]|nr:hypothetical protein BC30102_1994 [Bacillus cereus]